jgi:sec-independent protein translocase protein TatB
VFDIGAGEFIALAIVALIVLGPEKLPRYAAEAARVLRRVRQMANEARADVRRELGPEFGDLSLRDLNPRSVVRKHLLDPVDLDELDGEAGRARPRPPTRRASSAGSAAPPPYDPDTT